MSREALLKKIKKALALAKSANEHEAAAALATARRLMDEYGVDQAELAMVDVGETRAAGSRNETPARWEATLIMAVERALPVKPILRPTNGWVFVGLEPAPEIAAYAFTVLFRQLKAARAGYISTQLKRCTVARKRKRADLFCEGWASVVYRKIAALNPEQPLDDLVRQYLERRYSSLVELKPRQPGLDGLIAEHDRQRGRDSGRQAELNHGVAGMAPQLRIGGRA